MSREGRLRISCAALCRIRDDAGRYLLGLNRDRLNQGLRLYTPLGGALEYHAPDVLARFDAEPEDARSPDLRLFIDAAQLDDFRVWFLRREERETDPFRELCEELIDEFRVVSALAVDDVQVHFAGVYEAEAVTGRGASLGALTHYFHDIFDVTFVAGEVREALAALPPESGLAWFSEDALQLGSMPDGAVVDGRSLLFDTERKS